MLDIADEIELKTATLINENSKTYKIPRLPMNIGHNDWPYSSLFIYTEGARW